MSIERRPGFKTIAEINFRFAAALVSLGYGWLMWQWTSKEWWGLGIAAFLGLFGGFVGVVGTLIQIVNLVARERKIAKFERQAGQARADKMVGEDELRARRIIR